MDFYRLDVFPGGVGFAAEDYSAGECDLVWSDWIVCRVWSAYGVVLVCGDEVDVVRLL